MIVLRHFQAGSSATAASVSSIPIINAGDGPGQHPTQVTLFQTLLTESTYPWGALSDKGCSPSILFLNGVSGGLIGCELVGSAWASLLPLHGYPSSLSRS